jgi:hypothetical protein
VPRRRAFDHLLVLDLDRLVERGDRLALHALRAPRARPCLSSAAWRRSKLRCLDLGSAAEMRGRHGVRASPASISRSLASTIARRAVEDPQEAEPARRRPPRDLGRDRRAPGNRPTVIFSTAASARRDPCRLRRGPAWWCAARAADRNTREERRIDDDLPGTSAREAPLGLDSRPRLPRRGRGPDHLGVNAVRAGAEPHRRGNDRGHEH